VRQVGKNKYEKKSINLLLQKRVDKEKNHPRLRTGRKEKGRKGRKKYRKRQPTLQHGSKIKTKKI